MVFCNASKKLAAFPQSIVFTGVTIGAVIHISKANARGVSWGCTSVFIPISS